MATHYRRPLAIVCRLPRLELVKLRIAEREAPWGESAETLRAMYLAAVIRGASDGYTQESRQADGELSQSLLNRLHVEDFKC